MKIYYSIMLLIPWLIISGCSQEHVEGIGKDNRNSVTESCSPHINSTIHKDESKDMSCR